MLAWALVAWGGEPEPALTVHYLKDVTTLLIVAPKGEHIAPDAPLDLAVSYDGYTTAIGVPGSLASNGLRLPDLRGRRLDGSLSLSLCTDIGNQCRQSKYMFYGAVPAGKKGTIGMAVEVPKPPVAPPPPAESSPYKVDPTQAVDKALAHAAKDGKLVLLDFTAVWCPPCTSLSAEVLRAADAPQVLDGFLLASVDVDMAESWTLKDRYHVQGYPTVVAVSPDGAERARLLGYEDRAGFIAFLDRARGAIPKPESVTPAEAARIAWDTALNGGDPAPWLAKAPPDDPLARLAKFSASPTEADARWLVKNLPDRGADWAIAASTVVKSKDDKAAVAAVLERAIATRRGITAADLLEALADLRPEQAKVLHAAAAAAIRSSLTGEADHDKGFWTNLAHHQEMAGDVSGALATLDAASAAWPAEMTFELSEGKMLLRADRASDAVAHLEKALALAYGDNRLRVATSLAEADTKLGKAAEASELAKRILAESPVPKEGLDVRTPKYRADLEKYVQK
jgi:thiol-disulfide isomerase/thioredoxin